MRSRREEGRPFGLAILDRVMPDIDGAELAELIRRDPLLCNTRLLMLTSLDNSLDARQAERLRLTVMSKPIRQSRLFDAIVSLAFGNTADSKFEAAAPAASNSTMRRGDVLIADDNEINRLVASEILSSAGFRTSVVNNGVQAVHAVTQTKFDAVLMDCEMPEMDGFAATREIRRLENAGVLTSSVTSPLPIIALTAQAIQGDRQRCLDAGMTEYVTKPINRQQLFETLNACLKNRTLELPSIPEPPQAASEAPAVVDHEASTAPCIDIDEFTDRCMGKPHLVRDLLEMFAEAIDERATELSRLLSAGEISKVEQSARHGQAKDCLEIEPQLLTEIESCRIEIARLIECTPEAATELV
jgi:Amt family ammonium transporter